MTQTDVMPATAVTDDGPDLLHVFCCDPDVALCGTDVRDCEVEPPVERSDMSDCVVCLDLEERDGYCQAAHCSGWWGAT